MDEGIFFYVEVQSNKSIMSRKHYPIFTRRKRNTHLTRTHRNIGEISQIDCTINSPNIFKFSGENFLYSKDIVTCNEEEFLHYQLKPVFVALGILAAFPMQIKHAGKKD